ALKGLDAVPRDLELRVQGQQLEVVLGDVAHERQQHPPPRVLGTDELRDRRLVEAPDTPPDVQLPARMESTDEEVVRGGVGVQSEQGLHAAPAALGQAA